MAKAIALSLRDAKEFAERAVKKMGRSFVYRDVKNDDPRDCVYFETDGSPSCLIGMIFFFAGADTEPFLKEDDYMYTLNGDDVYQIRASGVLECDDITEEFLTDLQHLQDAGETWGDSIDTAIRQIVVVAINTGIESLERGKDSAGDHISTGSGDSQSSGEGTSESRQHDQELRSG